MISHKSMANFTNILIDGDGDEVNFRSQVSRDLKRVFLITQTTPIATSQDILQNCSAE